MFKENGVVQIGWTKPFSLNDEKFNI